MSPYGHLFYNAIRTIIDNIYIGIYGMRTYTGDIQLLENSLDIVTF